MTDPKLRIGASGFGGSGYKNPFTGEKVIGVTTALNAVDKPSLRQWVANQTAAYAAYIAEDLVGREEEQRYNMLRWYHSRHKTSDFDNPLVDIADAHNGVLNDAAQLGTSVHEWIEADLLGLIEPEIYRAEQEQMIVAYLEWKADQDIEVNCIEATVFGNGYGGTLDWNMTINGEKTLGDTKTSRGTYDTHKAQLAALGAADLWAREVPKGTEGAVAYTATRNGQKTTTYWVKDVPPPFTQYAILHLRPDEYDQYGAFTPAFCKLKPVSQAEIDEGYNLFMGAKAVRESQRNMKQLEKEVS